MLRDRLRARDRKAAWDDLRPDNVARTTHTRSASAPPDTQEPHLDMFLELLSPLGATHPMHNTKRALLHCTSDVALPFLQLCSGHLCDDSLDLAGPRCHLCAAHLCAVRKDDLTERERIWHHIWHNLVECPRRKYRVNALDRFRGACHNRLNRSSPEISADLCKMLDKVIVHAKEYKKGSVASHATRREFLSFILNPARTLPKGTHYATLVDVISLINSHRAQHSGTTQMCREHSDMSVRNTDSETDFDADEYHDAVAALCAQSRGDKRQRARKRSKRNKHVRNPRSSAASAARDADNTMQARGGLITPRCAPRRRNRRRQVVADAPVVG